MRILDFNAATNTAVTRDATPEEQTAAADALAEMENVAEQFKIRQAAVVSSRVKLKALGLTDQEINALLGIGP